MVAKLGQLKLPIERERFPDRNLHKGGRSFYFFDLDDNVLFLPTPIYLFDKTSGREVALTTGHFARISHMVGKPGQYENYHIDPDDERGSFRRFRDTSVPGVRQSFLDDIDLALGKLDIQWKGPSWDFFEHAVHNDRPLCIITARGHAPETIVSGLMRLYEEKHLSRVPNFLGLYPVSNKPTQKLLGASDGMSIATLKKAAIVHAVELAMRQYGASEHHRFGMSDDAPDNIALAVEALTELKRRFPKNAFFVFDTSRDPMLRIEVTEHGTREDKETRGQQLVLFDVG